VSVTGPDEHHEKPHLSERLARRRQEHLKRGRVYRIAFATAGIAVTLIGVGMLVLPGPALVVIPIGLTMLAMEFSWAERALERALEEAEKAQQRAKQASPAQRLLVSVAVVVAAGLFVVAAIKWDIPVLPVV
jgi:uncharacterized protein (TIGR02611 family)